MNLARQLLFGAGVSAMNIAIHAFAMTAVIQIARETSRRRPADTSANLVLLMMVTVLVITLAHCCEVAVWSVGYWVAGVVPKGGSASNLYFAFVNYTTLGYGDIVPVERWQLLGPMAAMNGVLLFGWSTAVIFEVLRRSVARTGDDAAGLPTSDAVPPRINPISGD